MSDKPSENISKPKDWSDREWRAFVWYKKQKGESIKSQEDVYKLVTSPVKSKVKRRKLPGQTCSQCEKYWQSIADDYGVEEAQRRIDLASRHRSLFKAPPSPPTFWDIDFNDDE